MGRNDRKYPLSTSWLMQMLRVLFFEDDHRGDYPSPCDTDTHDWVNRPKNTRCLCLWEAEYLWADLSEVSLDKKLWRWLWEERWCKTYLPQVSYTADICTNTEKQSFLMPIHSLNGIWWSNFGGTDRFSTPPPPWHHFINNVETFCQKVVQFE